MLKTYTTYTTYTLIKKLLWLYEYYFQCITFDLYTWYTLKFFKKRRVLQCKNKRGGKCTVMCWTDQVCKNGVDLNWCDVGGVNVFTNIYLYILPLNQYLQFKNHPLPYPPMKLLLIQSLSARRVTAHKAAS